MNKTDQRTSLLLTLCAVGIFVWAIIDGTNQTVTPLERAQAEQSKRAFIIHMQSTPQGGWCRDYFDTNGVILPPDKWPTNSP
jgi:hypothetical protein